MRLHLVRGDPAFSMLQPVRDTEWRWRGGTAVSDWEEVEFIDVQPGAEDFIAADCLTTNTGADGFLLSEFGREALDEVLSGVSEFWPVRVFGHRYWWCNCLACVDVLDRHSTEADWSSVEGAWGSFSWISSTRRLAFDPDRLTGMPSLFRLPEYPQGVLLAPDTLVDIVERRGLTGFRFDLIWSTQNGGVLDPPGMGFNGIFEAASPATTGYARALARETLRRRRTEI